MTSRNHQRSACKIRKILPKPASKGVVDAVLIAPPNLTLYLKLQNLLNYFVDCVHKLTSPAGDTAVWSEHLSRCIRLISELDITNTKIIHGELEQLLKEFVDDASQFHLFYTSLNKITALTADQATAALLTSKASHLQWLSVCILEDLKRSYTRS